MRVSLDDIRLDGGTQTRASLDFGFVQEYAESIKAGDTFPPIVLYYDGTDYWLGDGFHRWHAHKAAGMEDIEADIIQGTRTDAQWHSCGANKSHGLRRTNADKRRAVETALRLRPTASDRAIAEHCGVHPETVGTVRRERAPQVSESDTSTRTGKDGKQYPAAKPVKTPPVAPVPAAALPDPFDAPTGRTHHVGDDCDGGHEEAAETAPAASQPPIAPVVPKSSVLNARDRILAELCGLPREHALDVIARATKYFGGAA